MVSFLSDKTNFVLLSSGLSLRALKEGFSALKELKKSHFDRRFNVVVVIHTDDDDYKRRRGRRII